MIQANELRINDIFFDINKENYVKIVSIDRDGHITLQQIDNEYAIYEGYIDEDVIHSIPLTVGRLKNCGFIPETGNLGGLLSESYFTLNGVIIVKEKGYFVPVTFDEKAHFICKFGLSILSIHQLQNLYFALTNKELEVKFMKTPEEIAKQWCSILHTDEKDITLAFQLVKEKDCLTIPEFRQLLNNGVPVVGALKSYLNNDVYQIEARLKGDDSISYETLCNALELEYNRLTNKQS